MSVTICIAICCHTLCQVRGEEPRTCRAVRSTEQAYAWFRAWHGATGYVFLRGCVASGSQFEVRRMHSIAKLAKLLRYTCEVLQIVGRPNASSRNGEVEILRHHILDPLNIKIL